MSSEPSYLYLEIAESIRHRIAAGELASGDRLPPVREMAARWGCTPGTVGRAYALLAQEGLLEGQRGRGTRVRRSTLQPEQRALHWATLVNQAEGFLLGALSGGHTPEQAQTALSVAAARWRELQRHDRVGPAADTPAPGAPLRFVGSHDLLMESLARLLAEERGGYSPAQGRGSPALTLDYRGSLGGLMALAQGTADLAGVHLWDEATDSYNLPYVRRLLPGRRLVMLHLAHRSLGLIVPAGNPQALRALADLSRPGVVLLNRQRGSGTRVWLDAQLQALEVDTESIAGYDREALTHLAVASAVAEGEATAGLGIHAAAMAYGLGFVPLTQERYDLVIPESVWRTDAAQTLVQAVRSARFQSEIATLGGYESSETGAEQWVS
jgi:molybdate-binding protein/DNA-binding transcriptional regulator YhcF (GntR family)